MWQLTKAVTQTPFQAHHAEYLDISCPAQSIDETSSRPLPASSLLTSCLCNFIHLHAGHCFTLRYNIAGPAGWAGYSCHRVYWLTDRLSDFFSFFLDLDSHV